MNLDSVETFLPLLLWYYPSRLIFFFFSFSCYGGRTFGSYDSTLCNQGGVMKKESLRGKLGINTWSGRDAWCWLCNNNNSDTIGKRKGGGNKACCFSFSINKDRRFTPRYYGKRTVDRKFPGARQLYFVNERTIGSYMISSKKCVPEHRFGWWELSVRVKIEGVMGSINWGYIRWVNDLYHHLPRNVWMHSTCCTVRFCITYHSNCKNRTSHKVARAF